MQKNKAILLLLIISVFLMSCAKKDESFVIKSKLTKDQYASPSQFSLFMLGILNGFGEVIYPTEWNDKIKAAPNNYTILPLKNINTGVLSECLVTDFSSGGRGVVESCL